MEQYIGTYIRERRSELGLPLRKVASHINIDTSTLSKIEKNERKLNPELIDGLADCLQIDKEKLSKIHY
jgi:DNA (cytosine-5)-methyltransferase 1